MRILYKNAQVIGDNFIVPNCSVLTEGSKIVCVGLNIESMAAETVVDVMGNYLSAGFIDLHIHGGGGYDFMDATKKSIFGIANHHSRHGVTSMLATSVASSDKETFAMLDSLQRYSAAVKCCNYLGVHLEGPYLNPDQCGAIDPAYIIPPDQNHYNALLKYPQIKRMSIAPELAGALELGDLLTRNGVIASIAHTNADYDQVVHSCSHGYNLVTHLYSAMSGVHRRDAFRYGGVIEAALLSDELFVEVIADGCHLPKCLLKLIYKCKGRDKIILTSDASRGAGFKDGATIMLGSLEKGREAIIEDGVAKLPDRSAFAGSIASADRLIRTMVKTADVPLCDAVYMMTVTPARMLGIQDKKGSVKVGMDADIVIFDKDINIIRTVVMGDQVSNS